MHGHIIVCGLGNIGYRVVQLLLQLGEPVVVVTREAREEWRREAEAAGATVLLGDARDQHLLESAGVRTARALIAATDADLANVEIALDAKNLRPDLPIVARLFDPGLARRFEACFDLRRALEVAALAAPRFAAAALGEQVIGSFVLDGTLFIIGRATVEPGSRLAGTTLAELAGRYGAATLVHERPAGCAEHQPDPAVVLEPGDRVTVAAEKRDWERLPQPGPVSQVKRHRPLFPRLRAAGEAAADFWRSLPPVLRGAFVGLQLMILLSVLVFQYSMDLTLVDAFYFIITTVTTVGYGDITPRNEPPVVKLYGCLVMVLGSAFIATLYSIITDLLITARFQEYLGRRRIPNEGHVVVVGLGSVGFRVVEELRRAGAQVVAIDRNPDRDYVRTARAEIPVILGDARVPETLASVGAFRAAAVVAATGDDVANLSIVLAIAEQHSRARRVARLFDADFARKVRAALAVDEALSASLIAAPVFVAAALDPGVLDAFVLDDYLFSVLHRSAGDEWHDRAPADLAWDREGTPLRRRRADEDSYSVCHTPFDREEKVLLVVRRPLRTM